VVDNSVDEPATSEPIDLHLWFLPRLPGISDQTLRNYLFDIVQHGPESLVQPIRDEFAKRGLDPYTLEKLPSN
jgi:hypothetical protein